MITHPKHTLRYDLQLQSAASSLSVRRYMLSLDSYAEGRTLMLTPAVTAMQSDYIVNSARVALKENDMGLSPLLLRQ
jgi:hypothetical protein